MQDNKNQALSTASWQTTTQDQDLKMITDLWGAMIALFGVRWSSQFGETPDASGQWRQTLSGISRKQVAAALNDIRMSGRAWPPTAPEFRALCNGSDKPKHLPLEACYAELTAFVAANRKDKHNLPQILYHTITRNLDFYRFKLLEKEYERVKAFEIAYKATLFQLEMGESLDSPPAPETLLETDKRESKPVDIDVAEKTISGLMSMFEEPEVKPLTAAEIADNEKLERLK